MSFIVKTAFFSFFYDNILAIMKKKRRKNWHCKFQHSPFFRKRKQRKTFLLIYSLSLVSIFFDAFGLSKVDGEVNFTVFHLYFIRKTSAFLVANLFGIKNLRKLCNRCNRNHFRNLFYHLDFCLFLKFSLDGLTKRISQCIKY